MCVAAANCALRGTTGWVGGDRARSAPDVGADPDPRLIGRLFGPPTAASLLAPALVGELATGTGTWADALTGFF